MKPPDLHMQTLMLSLWNLIHHIFLLIVSRSEDDQQRQIAKLSSELKRLQDQGKIHDMDAMVHEHVRNISIHEFLGENRLEFNKRLSSKNFLAGEL